MKQKNTTTMLGKFSQDKVDKMVEKYPAYRIGDSMAMIGLLITMDMWLKIWMKELPPMAPQLLEAWNPVRIDWADRAFVSFTYTPGLEEPIHPEADDLETKVRKMMRFVTGANGHEQLLIGKSTYVLDTIGFEYYQGDWYVFKSDEMGRSLFKYIRDMHGGNVMPQSHVSPYASYDEALEDAIQYIHPVTKDFISTINKVTK